MTDTTQNILDLRPPKESMKAELYRLGLRYTYSTDNGEIWQNDTRGIRATITNNNPDTTTLEDITTHITQKHRARRPAERHPHRHDDRL